MGAPEKRRPIQRGRRRDRGRGLHDVEDLRGILPVDYGELDSAGVSEADLDPRDEAITLRAADSLVGVDQPDALLLDDEDIFCVGPEVVLAVLVARERLGRSGSVDAADVVLDGERLERLN